MTSRLSFAVRHALREGRSGVRKVGVYMASITLGVGALVAVQSFREDVARSVREQAEILLGADVRLGSDGAFPDVVDVLVDSLEAAGHESARLTSAVSMVMAPSSDLVRLVQVRGVDGAFPLYGTPVTVPEGLWRPGRPDDEVLVDPAVLVQLDVERGDSLLIGGRFFVVAGTVEGLPTDLAMQAAVGPRIWIAGEALRSAGLLGYGSLAEYEVFLRMPEPEDRDALEEAYRDDLRNQDVGFTTAESRARRFTVATDYLGRYLGLVGLGALLLGGIGVAGAVHVYVKEKLVSVAVLRCLGASQGSVFAAYLLQAAVLGLAGAAAGVVGGLLAQQVLPRALAGVLPVPVTPRLAPGPVLAGLGIGVWVSVLFALIPLLGIRDVPPLRAFRTDVDAGAGRRLDPLRLAAWIALAATVAGLCVLEAPELGEGLGFAAGLTVAVACLAGLGWAAVRLTRRAVPTRAAYPLRQGIANLFRPRNQTVAVILALGFAVFIVGTVSQVQSSLLATLALDPGAENPNLLLFDVQPDQEGGVLALLPPGGRDRAAVTPVVPARITALNGYRAADLLEDGEERRSRGSGPEDGTEPARPRPERWALRRDYRNTFRGHLTGGETLVAGSWWEDEAGEGGGSGSEPAAGASGSGHAAPSAERVSLERGLAEDLGVGLGDRITWDVAGREIESVVTSLREVDWERLEPNFFVVFEPGALEEAPRMSVILTRVEDPRERGLFQRELVRAFPNVSVLDITHVQEVVESVMGQVDRAVRFLGGIILAAGVLVLTGALAISRHQRLRESALLRTLGARRAQVLTVLLVEFLALSTLAALAGTVLGGAAAWALAERVFETAFVASVPALLGLWAILSVLVVAVGLLGSQGVLSRPPLATLRAAE